MVGRVGNEGGAGQAVHPVTISSGNKVGQVEPVAGVAEQQRNRQEDAQLFTNEKADNVVDSMNTFLAGANSQLKFVLHDDLKEYYVTIVDTVTDEVVREIPSKKLMDIHAAMREFVGLLVDRKI